MMGRVIPHIGLVIAAAACLTTAGCIGYHVGAVSDPGYKTVAVPMFRNRTVQPQMEAQVTNAIIKRLQQDGTLSVHNRDSADAVILGEITRYQRTPLRFQREDTTVPREYRVTITAKIEVRDQQTGKVLLPPTTVSGSADTFIGSDLQSADEQALPLAADDLAKQVVSLLVEKW